MMKKMLMASFIGAMLLLSGCSNTDGEDRLEIQQMLDDGNFDGVISALENDSDANATTIEENMQLGYSYMGAAGLSYSDLVTMMADTTTTTAAPSRSTRATDNDAFAKFAEKLQDNAADNPRVLEFLDKAIKMFERVATEAPGNDTDANLMLGMSQVAKATTTFTYLGDVVTLVENGIDNELLASACAIVHIYANPVGTGSVTNPTNDCASSIVIADDNTTDPYKEVKVTLKNNGSGVYRRLITSNGEDVVVTDGYIDAITGDDTNESNSGENMAKPVQDETLTVKAALVTTLNEGFDVIIDLAPDEATKDDIRAFRDEIDTDVVDGYISAKEISDYIEANI